MIFELPPTTIAISDPPTVAVVFAEDCTSCDCCLCLGEVTPPNTGRDSGADHQYSGPYGACEPNLFWIGWNGGAGTAGEDSDWLGEPTYAPPGDHQWTLVVETVNPGACFRGRAAFDDTMGVVVEGGEWLWLTAPSGFVAWAEFLVTFDSAGEHLIEFNVFNGLGFDNPTGLRVEWYECPGA